MLDMGWTEILVIGVVALIVVGPKDLPRMMRTVGQYAGKLRGMAREFQRSMDDAARDADLAEFKDIKDTLSDVKSVQSDAASAIRKGMSEIDKEIDKQADLKAEGTGDTTKPAEKPAEGAPQTKPSSSMSTTAAPVDKPDPSAGMSTGPEPGDLADEPVSAAAPAPEPRTASGA